MLTGPTLHTASLPITHEEHLERVIPARYQAARISTLDDHAPVVAQCVRDYLGQFWQLARQGIAPAFVGVTEAYKTTAAAVVARRVHLGARLPVTWVNVGSELPVLEAQWFRDSSGADRLLKLWQAFPFMVLDDLTMVTGGRKAELLGALIHARFDRQLPTCWTGNLNPKRVEADLANAFGAAVARRLLEGSSGYRIVI